MNEKSIQERLQHAIDTQLLNAMEAEDGKAPDATVVNAAIRWYTTRFGAPKRADGDDEQKTIEETLMDALSRGVDARRQAVEERCAEDAADD